MVAAHPIAPSPSRARDRLQLLALAATLALGALALQRLAGPPHLPAALPSLAALKLALVGTAVPYAALTYALTSAAWLVWLWLVGSLALRLALAGAEATARSAAWVRSLRALSDRVTLPMVRRLVDGAVATATVVQLVSRTTPLAAAASLPARPTPIVAQLAPSAPPALPARHAAEARALYTVQPGDTLWAIAERFYGDGDAFPRLVAANAGRPMPGGEVFTRAGQIRDGWVLIIPGPTKESAATAAKAEAVYMVQPGDTLRGIAAHAYGDEMRWPAIYRANARVARAPNGETLTDPNRIWPGMRLTIPALPMSAAPQAPGAPARHAQAPTHGAAPGALTPAATASATRPPGRVRPAAGATAPKAAPSRRAATAHRASPVAAAPRETATSATATSALRRSAAIAPLHDHVAGARPAPTPTAPAPSPTPIPRPAIARPAPSPGAPIGELVLLGFGGVAVVGAASVLARRRRNARGATPPLPDEDPVPVDAGFAAAAAARVVAGRATPEDAEPALVVAAQTQRFLAKQGAPAVRLVAIRQGRRAAALTLACPAAERDRLVALAPALGRRLGGVGRATLTPDGDVALALGRLDALGRLLPTVEAGTGPLLLPLGALPNHQLLYAAWDELGHVLIAGEPGGGATIVLASLLGALVSRRSPAALRLRLVAARHSLPEPLTQLPHLVEPPIDPTDAEGVRATVAALYAELERRMALPGPATPGHAGEPDLALVVDEMAALGELGEALDALLLHGPAYGVRFIAATSRPMAIDDATLRHFETRLVLRLEREAESVLLLGHGAAAELGAGGAMLARVAGREAIRLRGFRIADDHWAYLLRTMVASSTALERPVPALPAAMPGAPGAPTEAEPPIGASPPPSEAELGPASPSILGEQPIIAEATAAPATDAIPVEADDSPDRGDPEDAAGVADGADPGDAHDGDATGAAEPVASATASAGSSPTGSGPQPLIQIECFGAFRVLHDGVELKPEGVAYNMYRPWEVLAYLAVHPPGPVPRKQLTDDIWADWDEVEPERLQARVRTVLARIRRLFEQQIPDLPAPAVFLDRQGRCRLDTTLVHSEAHEFLALIRASATLPPPKAMAACRRARALYRGDLLADSQYEWLFAPALDAGTLQQAYRQQYRTVTARLAQLSAAQGAVEEAAALYRQLLSDDSADEPIALRLFECHARLGDLAALRRDYRWLERLSRDQYHSPLGPRATAAYEAALAMLTSQAPDGAVPSRAPSAS